jgi:uncharacterized protein with FMN-binding domain
MKKVLLSAAVIVSFIAYSVFGRKTEPTVAILPTPEPLPTAFPTAATTSPVSPTDIPPNAKFRDGQYTGTAINFLYGTMQVKAVISSGKLADVQFLQYPNDRRTSVEINTQAMPYLKAEAIQAQSGQVDIVSGATDSSLAFVQSLTSALNQAGN